MAFDTVKFEADLQVDLNKALKELRIALPAYERILLLSLVSSEAALAVMSQALDAKDMAALKRAAHELKGVYVNLRISSLSDVADQISHGAQEGMDIVGLRQLCSRFVAHFESLKEILGGA